MRRHLLRLWPWLVLGCLTALALYRYGVTRSDLASLLPQLWLCATGMGLTLLLIVSALGIGFPLLRLLVPVEGQAGAPLLAAGLGLGTISLLTLFIGLLGALYPATAWAILIGGALLAVIQAKRWRAWARSVTWREIMDGRPRFTLFCSFLLFASMVSFVYALTANGFTPPRGWDESAYHLALPKLYVGEHRIFTVPFIHYSTQPFNAEMLFTLALLLRSEVMASLLSLAFAWLLTGGLWLFTLEAFGRRAAFLVVALFWTVPAVSRLAGSTHVEVPLAAYGFLSVWAFWRWHTDAKGGCRWLVLSALFGGLAAGTKLTGALMPLILATLVVFYGWHRRRPLKTIAGQAGLFGGIAFLLVLPWFTKSYVHTGNPIWPFLNDWFGGRYWDALAAEYYWNYLRSTNLPMTLGSFLTAPWILTVKPHDFDGQSLGLLIAVFTPLALVFRPNREKPIGVLAAIVGLFYVGWFFMTHQVRFLVPIAPCLCVLSGYALDRLLAREGRLFLLALQCLVIGLVLIEMPGIQTHITRQWVSWLPYLVGAESREEALAERSDTMAAYIWANEHLPTDAKVVLMPYENRGYFLDRDYLWGSPIQRIIKLEQFESSEALWRDLRARGTTHLLEGCDVVFEDIRHWPKIKELWDGLKATYAEPIYVRDRAAVYQLRQ